MKQVLAQTLWRTTFPDRHFIIPDDAPRPAGPLALVSLAGDHAQVDPAWAARFEVSEAGARVWAREEAGLALGALREAADARLAAMRTALDAAKRTPVAPDSAVTPDAVPAMVALLRALPRAVLGSVSGDPSRVIKANAALGGIEARLNAAGVEVGTRLGNFPYRLAALRREFEAARSPRGE